MPLLSARYRGYENPMGAVSPRSRRPDVAPLSAPNLGDHVFGDVIGAVEGGLKAIIGEGQNWEGRFCSQVFNGDGSPNLGKTTRWNQALVHWNALKIYDLGHKNNEHVRVERNPPDRREPDNHSVMFGHYAGVFKWELCEISCVSTSGRMIGASSPAQGMNWVDTVCASYDKMMKVLVDQTALDFYSQGLEVRDAIGPQPLHEAIPMSVARSRTARMVTLDLNRHHKIRICTICDNFDKAKSVLRQLLESMHYINIFWHEWMEHGVTKGRWESLVF